MATKTAQKRLTLEYKGLVESPPAYIEAHPNEANILEWYYIITGPPDTPYAGGQYMGTLTFPADYPFNPPAIRMLTPSGRFDPGYRLCLSISDYHPKTWNPSWSVATILVGLLSFMTSDEQTAGSVSTTTAVKKRFAQVSKAWNLKNPRFQDQFPKICEEMAKENPAAEEPASMSSPPPSALGLPPWVYVAGAAVLVGAVYKIL